MAKSSKTIALVLVMIAILLAVAALAMSQLNNINPETETREQACTNSGGTVETQLCCKSVEGSFPDTCVIGACGCSADNSKEVTVCTCPEGKCWNRAENACVSR